MRVTLYSLFFSFSLPLSFSPLWPPCLPFIFQQFWSSSYFLALFHLLAGKRLLRGILPLKNQPMGSNSTRTHTKHVVDDSDDDSTSLLSNSTKSSKSVHVFKKFLFGHHRKHQQQRIKESVFHKRTKRHSGCTVNSSCSLGSSNSNSSTRSNPTVSARWSRESSLGGEVRYIISVLEESKGQNRAVGGRVELAHAWHPNWLYILALCSYSPLPRYSNNNNKLMLLLLRRLKVDDYQCRHYHLLHLEELISEWLITIASST